MKLRTLWTFAHVGLLSVVGAILSHPDIIPAPYNAIVIMALTAITSMAPSPVKKVPGTVDTSPL